MPTLATQGTLDRMSAKRTDAEWLTAQRDDPDTRILVLADLKPVIEASPDRTVASTRWFHKADLEGLGLPVGDALFLGISGEGGGRFALPLSEHYLRAASQGGDQFRPVVDLRSLAMQGAMSREELSIVGQARALAGWHEMARCCGRCGGTTLVRDGGWRRRCWACGQDWFPRTDPVVIMLVTDGERCLLAHEHRYAENMYSTLAGFIEHGEDIEHAVRREVMEETGIKVGEVRYHSSQPWPFPHSLMLGCFAIAKTSELDIDPVEIAEARWFSRSEALAMLDGRHPEGLAAPGPHAIAHILIRAFVDEE